MTRRRRLATATVMIALVCITFMSITLQHPGQAGFDRQVDDLSEVAVGLVAGAIIARVALRSRGRARAGWLLMTGGCLAWSCGMSAWSYDELVSHTNALNSTWCPVAMKVALFCGLLAAFALPALRTSSKLRVTMDGLIAASGIFVAAWATTLGPTLRASHETLWTASVDLISPLAEIVLTAIFLVMAAQALDQWRLPLGMTAAGFALMFANDTALLFFAARGQYRTPNPIDAGWIVALLVMAAGASCWEPASDAPDVRLPWLGPAVPYAPVAAGGGLAIWRWWATGTIDPVVFVVAVVLLIVVGIRQAVSAVENRTLSQSLNRTHADLRRSELRFRSLIEADEDFIAIAQSDGTITYASPAARNVFRCQPSAVIGTRVADLGGADGAQALNEGWSDALRTLGTTVGPFCWKTSDDDSYFRYLEATFENRLHDEVVTGIIITVRDTTVQREAESHLLHAASHDPLTGLANRSFFLQRLAAALAQSAPGYLTAVLFCDLDHFKQINDNHGHLCGDQVLVEISNRLTRTIRNQDFAARFGGDEFVVCCPRVTDEDEALHLAERVASALALPVRMGMTDIEVSVSVGLRVAQPETSAQQLLREADTALYQAKDTGRARVSVYAPF